MRDLERELRTLSGEVAWPETPDLATAVRPRLEPRPRFAVGARRALVLLAVLVAGGVAAVEPARSAVLEFLGLKSVRIERREPTATPAPPGAELDLGRPVTLGEAARRAAPPTALGEPSGAFLSDVTGLTYVYGPGPDLIVMQTRATVTPFIEKSVGGSARLERFRIGGDPAYFISGAAHGVAFSRPGGEATYDPQRLAGDTLLLERGDGLLIRIEGDVDRARATAIARSIPRRLPGRNG